MSEQPVERVARESRARIADHLGRQSRYNPTKSLTAITGQITLEYEGRFLIELVQNAYDAQPPGSRDGRVHVLLDESVDGGAVLYVANTGTPFGSDNFEALTNIAQSSKPPGEGIGNKGVGFRSVLQVCEWPEIYSRAPDDPLSPGFGGFCFGFADDDDIRDRVDNEDDFRVVTRDFSRYLLPVPAIAADPVLARLHDLGMVTVIRLPLAGDQARAVARDQVARLIHPTPPVALFLERLSSVVVEHLTAGEEPRRTTVRRSTSDVLTQPDLTMSRVDLSGRDFLLVSRALPADAVREVIRQAVDGNELDPSWRSWDSDATVALAVAVDGQDALGHPMTTYTYLPMGVPSPLHAHLHAPFHTRMARLDLNEKSRFNAFLVEAAADLAADVIRLLVKGAVKLDAEVRRVAVADLLCWDDEHVEHLRRAFLERGQDITTAPLVPARNRGNPTWASLRDVRDYRPPDDRAVLTSHAVEHHALLVDQSIGTPRVDRLGALAEACGVGNLRPTDDEVAAWVEKVAATVPTKPVARYDAFLGEVAAEFADRSPAALRRRRVLVDSDGKRRRTGPRADDAGGIEPTVFLPPATAHGEEDGDTLSVPRGLQRAVVFLHEGIRTRTRTGSTFKSTPVGELLGRADLVERFELASVLGHVQRLLAAHPPDKTCEQALSWVYAQERRSRARNNDLPHLGLRVPTASGWTPAGLAVFSAPWQTPRAATTAALVSAAGRLSPSLADLGRHTVLAPEQWPFRIKDVTAFRDFLSRCGVRDGLRPTALRSKTPLTMDGVRFTAATVAARFDLAGYAAWDRGVHRHWKPSILVGPYTPYTGERELRIVPGQDAFDLFGPDVKELLAAAILDSVEDWPEETWHYRFQRQSSRHQSRPDPQRWPSPAHTFFQHAEWFPMADAGSRDEHYFVAPREGWTFDETGKDTAPRFARLAPVEHRRRISASAETRDHLARASLATWNDRRSATRRLGALAELIEAREVSEAESSAVLRAVRGAWSDLVADGQPWPGDHGLIVSRGSEVEVLDPADPQAVTAYVHDVPPGLAAQVLDAVGAPVLIADHQDGRRIIALAGHDRALKVVPTSRVEAGIVVDGVEQEPSADIGRPLVEVFGSWAARLVIAIVDLRSQSFARVTDRVLNDLAARLRRVRLVTGSPLGVVVDGRPVRGRPIRAAHLDDPQHPFLALDDSELAVPSWAALDVLADDLAELIGQAPIAAEIRAAALALERSIGGYREPRAAELEPVLRVSAGLIARALRTHLASTDHVRFLVVPFVHVAAGLDAARSVADAEVDDVDELRARVARAIGDTDALFTAALRAETIDQIRRETGVGLGPLNAALHDLDYPPLHFADTHRTVLATYLDDHRTVVLDALRNRFLGRFTAAEDLSGYTAIRDLREPAPDPAWLDEYEVPPADLVAGHVERWVAAQGRPPATTRPLAPVDQVRQTNHEFLGRALRAAGGLVTTWCVRSGIRPPDGWTELTPVRDSLAASGCLDFVELDEAALITWLARLGHWPEAMPAHLDHDRFGFTDADRRNADSANHQEELDRRRRRTELTFGHRVFDTSTDLAPFVEAVDRSVDATLLGVEPTSRTLEVVTRRAASTVSRASGVPTTARVYGSTASNEQKSAIGVAGEVIAYRWLQSRYRETTPDSWVSANRKHLVGGHPGDDSLGYDFKVGSGRATCYFEVKATTTDRYEFELGPSELRAAYEMPPGSYRIIFVSSVLNPAERELLVLPNPVESLHRHRFQQVGRGVHLRFTPTTE
ncbi:DUF3883 domain-containing protein [Actinosynnema sp. NPDC023587]|uniref:sacsin N-terminal ATP-binding-like domain-containing protein n=1 Tax=Actinosynnema sp. NPDC023587 TaxID=3154695 RepID=UPI0034094604